MTTIKSYTDIEQSKVLAKILPTESADMWYEDVGLMIPRLGSIPKEHTDTEVPCWSLAALLNILHSKEKDIPSLSGGGYKDGKYISDWCLDYEFDDGGYEKTFANNPLDACYETILKSHKLNL